jgi:hypothetical protein
LTFLIEIEVSRPSVTLRKRQQLKAFSVTLQQTVTLHRDTSIPLGGSEVSRQVWTSSVRHPALTLATATFAIEGRRFTASTARSAAIEAQARTRAARRLGDSLVGSMT